MQVILVYYQQAKAMNIGSPTFSKEVDKEIARAVVDDDEKLNEIFEEIDQQSEVGQFTQDEPAQEDQEVEQEKYNERQTISDRPFASRISFFVNF